MMYSCELGMICIQVINRDESHINISIPYLWPLFAAAERGRVGHVDIDKVEKVGSHAQAQDVVGQQEGVMSRLDQLWSAGHDGGRGINVGSLGLVANRLSWQVGAIRYVDVISATVFVANATQDNDLDTSN